MGILEESIVYNLLSHPPSTIPLRGPMKMLVISTFLILICVVWLLIERLCFKTRGKNASLS